MKTQIISAALALTTLIGGIASDPTAAHAVGGFMTLGQAAKHPFFINVPYKPFEDFGGVTAPLRVEKKQPMIKFDGLVLNGNYHGPGPVAV